MPRIQDVEILLVDDNPDLLDLLCQTLHGAGYTRLRTAGTCAQARAAFAQSKPGLVVLDINLPDGDGFSLFRELNGAGRSRCFFCPPGMPTPTGCLAWALGRMII